MRCEQARPVVNAITSFLVTSAVSKKLVSLFVVPAKAGIQSFGLWIPHQVRNDTLKSETYLIETALGIRGNACSHSEHRS